MTEKKYEGRYVRVPERIEVDYPYVVLADFEHVFGRFEGVLGNTKVNEFEKKVSDVLTEASPDLANTVSLKVNSVIEEVEKRIEAEREKEDGVGVVMLDRYIKGNENGDFFRLEVSRGVNGGLVSRPGCADSVDEQFEALANWVLEGKYKKLIVVDDVLAFGDTLTPMLNGFKKLIPETELKVLVGLAASGGGWQGLERVKKETEVEIEAVVVVKAGEENEWTSGMAMPALRDFTFLGGKVDSEEVSGRKQNFPYFLPFSFPVISFMPKERRYEAGLKMIDISIAVVEEMNKELGRDLEIQDLLDAGFGVPSCNLDFLQRDMWVPNNEDSVWEYLQYSKNVLVKRAGDIKREMMK